MSKEKILEILEKNENKIITGGYISNLLSISRNGVWKNINILRNEGYNISSVPNKGYIYKKDNVAITPYLIRSKLNTKLIGNSLEIIESTDSTNNHIKRKLMNEHLDEGYLIIAKEQKGGRGRYGRSFFSPKGGAYFSFLLSPKNFLENQSVFTIISALATLKAIEELTTLKPKIKWVNDLLVENKKICGILTEGVVSIENNEIENIIVGIGVNVNPPKEIPKELVDIVSYINIREETDVSISDLIALIINNFEDMYLNFHKNKIYEEYFRKMAYLNKEVTVYKNGEESLAIVKGITKEFNILLDFDGEIISLSSGEISIKK